MGSGDRDDDALAPTETPPAGLDETLASESRPREEPGTIGPGAVVGRLVLGPLLGAGGMGIVHRAHDPELDRAVAVKLVRARLGGSSGKARLVREAQAMAKLRHPNVVAIFDVGTLGDDVFVVMPLLEGGTLGAWTRAAARPWGEVVDRYLAAGRGLAAAHAADLVHRDFKPDNVLLGAGGEVQVADFGLARLDRDEVAPAAMARLSPPLSLDLTRTGDVLGTPAYMAPEQMRGAEVDARADQFSFCVALWEGVFGTRPFARADAIAEGRVEPPAAGRDAPAWLRAILLRGLRADPAGRWPSMQALLDAIAARRHPVRGRLPLVAALAAALILAGVAIAVLARDDGQPLAFPRDDAPAPRSYHEQRVTQRGDVLNGALSPDGRQLALVTPDRVIVRGVEPTAAERTILRLAAGDGVRDLAWSPDGTELALTLTGTWAIDDPPGNVAIVAVDSGSIDQLAFGGSEIAYASADTIVSANDAGRSIWFRSRADGAVVRECPVPGDYTWLSRLDVIATGDVVVTTSDADGGNQVTVIGPDCRIGTGFPAGEKWVWYTASSDRRSFLALEMVETMDLVEWSLDGTELSRGTLPDDVIVTLIGGHQGRRYWIARSTQTTVERWRSPTDRRVLLTSGAVAKVMLAPDLDTVAWIESSTGPGPLRIVPLADLAERGPPVLEAAMEAGWSPDGKRLAVSRLDGPVAELVVLDLATRATRTVAFPDLAQGRAPVWIDDRRVALQSDDYKAYPWIDVDTGETGELIDGELGWAHGLSRSPRDGTLAMLWNRPPGEDIYTMRPGKDWAPTGAGSRSAVPMWSPGGELLLIETSGVVDRVGPGGGREPLARIALTPQQQLFDVDPLRGGELLITILESPGDITVAIPE